MLITDLKWRKPGCSATAIKILSCLGLSALDDILDWDPSELDSKVSSNPIVWVELCYALVYSKVALNRDWVLFVKMHVPSKVLIENGFTERYE